MNDDVKTTISPKSKKEKLFTFLRIFISLLLLSFLVFRNWGNFGEILGILRSYNAFFIAAALVFFVVGIFVEMLRWEILLRANNVCISKAFLFQSVFIGYFYSNIFPTNIGGDIYRGYDIHTNKNVPNDKNISSIVVERFIGMLSGTIYLVISFFSVYKYFGITFVALLSVLPVLGLLLFFMLIKPDVFKINALFKKIRFLRKFEGKYNDFLKNFKAYKNKSRFLLYSFIYSLLGQMVFFVSYYMVSLYLKMDINFLSFFFIIPVVLIVSNIPISIGGIGIRENTIFLLLSKFGVDPARATFFSLLILFVIMATALLGGLTYVFKNIFFKSKTVI
jgi:glycosyltransferase 2 family protein